MSLNPDNRFFSFMSLLGDLILLNLLFILTSIPIITIGPSLCALYSTIKKRLNKEESYIIKDYKNAWKENAKGGICIWAVLFILLAGMLLFTSYVAAHLTNLPLLVVYMILFMWLSFTLLYAFPLQATFINTPFHIIVNSILTSLCHLPWTIAMFLTTYLPMAFTLVFPRIIGVTAVYWIVIGFSLSMVCIVKIMKKVLVSYLAPQQ